MVIHNKPVIVYDIEVFPNVFHCTCKNTETGEYNKFEISQRRIDIDSLVEFFNRDYLFCGYNNKRYDDVVINYIIMYRELLSKSPIWRCTDSIYKLSQTVVLSKDGDTKAFRRWMFANYFESMDLLTMLFSSKLRVGLKEMQITMFYHNVQEYDGDFNEFLPLNQIDKMIEYNINDVDSTEQLLNTLQKKGEIDVRLFMEDEYNINALSMDSVKFGETMLLKEYCKRTHQRENIVSEQRSPMDYVPLKDVILPFITYKNPILQGVLEDMKRQVVPTRKELIPKGQKAYEKCFVISKTRYSVGVGGIHSLNKPEIFVPSEGEYIGHADVTSMYPSLLYNTSGCPVTQEKNFGSCISMYIMNVQLPNVVENQSSLQL